MAVSLAGEAKKAVREGVGKTIEKQGFSMFDDRTFFRRRGDLLDGIGVRFGRGVDSFYVHYFTKIVADPVNSNPNSYRVGTRLQSTEPGSDDWVVTPDNAIAEIFERITATVVNQALPYFESVASVRDYVVEVACDVNFRARLTNFDLAVALAILERKNRVIQLCEETLQAIARTDALSDADRNRIAAYATELRSAATQGRLKQLLEQWKAAAIEKLGLKA